MRFRFDPLIIKQALNSRPGKSFFKFCLRLSAINSIRSGGIRSMLKIKSVSDAPDFKSSLKQANARIFDLCVRWGNAQIDLKDKQMGDFI